MGVVLLVTVLLAAAVTIASGVWVAIGLMAALRYPGGRKPENEASPPDVSS